jgi:hypothetical protein
MSGANDSVNHIGAELENITGSPEEAARIAGWWQERVPLMRALWDAGLPADDRLRILAATVERIADLFSPTAELIGDPARLSYEDARHVLVGLAEMLAPDSGHEEHLIFARHRAGNPNHDAATSWSVRRAIGREAERLYVEMRATGHKRKGLKKRVSDIIGQRFGKNGSTVDRLWRVPKEN